MQGEQKMGHQWVRPVSFFYSSVTTGVSKSVIKELRNDQSGFHMEIKYGDSFRSLDQIFLPIKNPDIFMGSDGGSTSPIY